MTTRFGVSCMQRQVPEPIYKMAVQLQLRGWTLYIIGGWVRDKLLGYPSKDVDVEIEGNYTFEELRQVLELFGAVKVKGKAFGCFELVFEEYPHLHVDVGIPRRDNKIGIGHKQFEINLEPLMSRKEAAKRRDYTINSMAYDPVLDLLIDPFDGEDDLYDRRLTPTSEQFGEDPLRAPRGFNLISRGRADFWTQKTIACCYKMAFEYYSLSTERIWEEWRKWATGQQPGRALQFLDEIGWLELYPVLKEMRGCPQDLTHHPEGDVWRHTILACDAMAELTAYLDDESRVPLMFAALLHDSGKPFVTEWDWEGDQITSRGHDEEGALCAEQFLQEIGAPRWVIDKVVPLVRWHMHHIHSDASAKNARKLALNLQPASVSEWIKLVAADMAARPPLDAGIPQSASQLYGCAVEEALLDEPPERILMGRHVLANTKMKPGPRIGTLLDFAFDAQIDGEFDDLDGAIQWLRGPGWIERHYGRSLNGS